MGKLGKAPRELQEVEAVLLFSIYSPFAALQDSFFFTFGNQVSHPQPLCGPWGTNNVSHSAGRHVTQAWLPHYDWFRARTPTHSGPMTVCREHFSGTTEKRDALWDQSTYGRWICVLYFYLERASVGSQRRRKQSYGAMNRYSNNLVQASGSSHACCQLYSQNS